MIRIKAEKKAERLAALFGLEAPKPPTAEELRRSGDMAREAEAVILFTEDRAKFIQRPCRVCLRVFAVNRSHISCCSDDCRGVRIAELGLEWDPKGRSPEERWSTQTGGPEPLVVPPTVLELLGETQPLPLEEDAVAG